MKVRSDYVTNSSSSSFILSFKDENSIYQTLKEQFPEDIENGWSAGNTGYLYQLLNEIEEADRLTLEDVEEMVEDESWAIKWRIRDELEIKNNMSYSESQKFLETSEGKKLLEDKYNQIVNNIVEKIGDNKVIVEVEHGDGGEGEDGMLEHEILPQLDCTVVRFSHH